MKKLIFTALFFLSFFVLVSAQNAKYSRVLINIEKSKIASLGLLGIPLEGYHNGDGYVSELSESDIQKLTKKGITYTVLIDDIKAYYKAQNLPFINGISTKQLRNNNCTPPPYPTPLAFELGGMGGFFTYNELLAHLDSMYSHYPQYISQKQPVDTISTFEGRPLYWVRISNNPQVEQNKPRVLYTALTHAREPAGMQQLFFFMYFILENPQHPDIANLLNNYELYFIPCINPDGYIQNEITDPTGGGLWRKNRRDNGDGTFGVDLNRNFGYEWGYDDQGSSPDPSSETYRGTSGFSEPETRMLKSFCEHYQFKTTLNYHTFSNVLLYPFGYAEDQQTPDSLTYKTFASLITKVNKYMYGTPFQALGYLGNGDSNDWMYGEQVSKPPIFAFTVEAGSPVLAFWPPMNKIEDICRINAHQNIYAAYVAGKFAHVESLSTEAIQTYFPQAAFSILNAGLDSNASFTVSMVPLSANIQNTGSAHTYPNLHHLQTAIDSISFTLDLSTVPGDTVSYLLSVDNGVFVKSDTVVRVFGHEAAVFTDICNDISMWTSTSWGVSTAEYVSASSSITDSPGGSYQNNNSSSITLSSPISLLNAYRATLNFNTMFDIAEGYDYVQLLISADNGNTWAPLCGQHTIISDNSNIEGQPAYEGIQKQWLKESINLNDYLGTDVLFRFNLVSNWWPWNKPDGFYFDDFTVTITDTTFISAVNNAISLEQSFEVFPNPAENMVNITHHFSTEEPIFIEITDCRGQTVFKKRNVLPTEQIITENWAGGIYIIRLFNSKGINVVKKMAKY